MKKLLPWGNFALTLIATTILAFSFWVNPGVAPVAQLILLIDIAVEMFVTGYTLHKQITEEEDK